MTMLDEDRLRSLLTEAAQTFEAPATGPEHVLAAAAATTGRRTASGRSHLPRTTRGRVVLAAAVVMVVVAISLVGTGLSGTSHRRAAVGTSPAVPTTTLPSRTGAGATSGSAAPQYGGSNAPNSPAPTPATVPSPSPPSLPPGSVGQSAKVVTTGSVDLAIGTGSLNSVVNKLTQFTVGYGGFVAKSQLQLGSVADGSASYGSLVLQVPQPSFNDLLKNVEGVGKVTSQSSTSTDVTGQYVDLQARISALQASLQQYLTILSKATSIGDILSVQNQIDSIQSQIEQLQGQLNLLNSQTTYATLTVSLSQQGHPVPPPPPPSSGISKAWHDSVNGFTSGFEWLVRIAGRTLFVLVLLALLGVAGRWAWRRRRFWLL